MGYLLLFVSGTAQFAFSTGFVESNIYIYSHSFSSSSVQHFECVEYNRCNAENTFVDCGNLHTTLCVSALILTGINKV